MGWTCMVCKYPYGRIVYRKHCQLLLNEITRKPESKTISPKWSCEKLYVELRKKQKRESLLLPVLSAPTKAKFPHGTSTLKIIKNRRKLKEEEEVRYIWYICAEESGFEEEKMMGDEINLNCALWYACAGPHAYVPKRGDRVVYFPQAHLDQVKALTKQEGDTNMPVIPIPYKIICEVANVQLKAEPRTDEVFAHITLLPEIHVYEEQNSVVGENSVSTPRKAYAVKSFCKRLTASDTSTHGGFTVPKRHAIETLPPLDTTAEKPAQELVTKDFHGAEWRISHIFRGNPKRHLLTSGWSSFVTSKMLVTGDAFVFVRGENGQLRVGVRRAMKEKVSTSASIISDQSMQLGVLASASHALSTGTFLHIFYHPWACPAGFLVPYDHYMKSTEMNYTIGSRFQMFFEGEDFSEHRLTGNIIAIEDEDPIRWPNSEWRSFKVKWHPFPDGLSPPERVSHWNIEPVEPLKRKTPTSPPPPFHPPKMPRIPNFTGSGLFHVRVEEPQNLSADLQVQERIDDQIEAPHTPYLIFPPNPGRSQAWRSSSLPLIPKENGLNPAPVPSAKSNTSGPPNRRALGLLHDLNIIPDPAPPEEGGVDYSDKCMIFGVNLSDHVYELPSQQVAVSEIGGRRHSVPLIANSQSSASSEDVTSNCHSFPNKSPPKGIPRTIYKP